MTSPTTSIPENAALASARIQKLRKALASLIGAESIEELQAMEVILRSSPVPAADKASMLDAIHALLETYTPDTSDPSPADLFSVFDECLNRHPFLLIEVGYNRLTDWMVTIWNARGVRIADAPIVISTSSHDRGEAMAEAAGKLRKQFLQENDQTNPG